MKKLSVLLMLVAMAIAAGPVIGSNPAESSGLFSATIDFGAGAFTGRDFWLEFDVSPAGSNPLTDLSVPPAAKPANPLCNDGRYGQQLLGRLPGTYLTGPINASPGPV